MRKIFILVVCIICVSCRAPISYINNLPQPSLLEKQGDLNLKANLGADARILHSIIDLDAAVSPLDHWGIRAHLTGKMSSKYYSEIGYRELGVIYYTQKGSDINAECQVGFGQGTITGDNFVSRNPDYFTPASFRNSFYRNTSRFSKMFLQSSVQWNVPKEEGLMLSTGIRAQNVAFSEYRYEEQDDWLVDDRFNTFILDTFIYSSFQKEHFGFTSMVGYSLPFETKRLTPFDDPVYRRFYFSLGVLFSLSSK